MKSIQRSAIRNPPSPRTASRGNPPGAAGGLCRDAFTLTEILITIALIALLISISVSIISGTGTAARRAATVATIKKVDELLHTRMDGFNRWLSTQSKEALAGAGYKWGMGDGSGPMGSHPLSELLGRKRYFRYYFPQTASDAQLEPGDSQYFPNPISIPTGTNNPNTESAELLYFLLTHAQSYGAEPVGDDAFTTGEIADTDNDGLNELVDGWGRPLRFYRWPTRLIRGGAWANTPYTVSANAQALMGAIAVDTTNASIVHDPDDTYGLILDAITADAAFANNFEQRYHTADTYHAPLVVSAGVDGLFGLYEPSNTANQGYLCAETATAAAEIADNITNLNQRAGSR